LNGRKKWKGCRGKKRVVMKGGWGGHEKGSGRRERELRGRGGGRKRVVRGWGEWGDGVEGWMQRGGEERRKLGRRERSGRNRIGGTEKVGGQRRKRLRG